MDTVSEEEIDLWLPLRPPPPKESPSSSDDEEIIQDIVKVRNLK